MSFTFTEEQVNKFSEYDDGDASGPCPSCSAMWVETRMSDGVVFVVMDHDKSCAYLAWCHAPLEAWVVS